MTEKVQGPILNVSEVKAMEKGMIENGTPAAVLMDRAGFAVAQAAAESFDGGVDDIPKFKVVILAGTGNNGGDGWVSAMYLSDVGFPVTLVTPVEAADMKAEPARSAAMTLAASEAPVNIVVAPTAEQLDELLAEATVVIDAMAGIGFSGEKVEEPYASWIEAVNEHHRNQSMYTVAVDTPTGLSAQTGKAVEPCFRADVTVTMLAYKPGLVMEDTLDYRGIVALAPLTE